MRFDSHIKSNALNQSAEDLTETQEELYFEGASIIFSSFHTFFKEGQNPFYLYQKIVATLRRNPEFRAVGDSLIYKIYASSFRNRESISCFRLARGLEVKTLVPSGSEVQGKVRIYFTFYRAGFLIISYVLATHSYLKGRDQEKAQSYGLVASSPFTGRDLLYMIADPSAKPQTNYLTYIDPVSKKMMQGTFDDFEKLSSNLLKTNGIEVYATVRQHSRAIFCWKIKGSEQIEDVSTVVERYPYEIWFILTTPVEKEKKITRRLLDDVQRSFVFTSKEFCFNMTKGVLLILRNRRKKPRQFLKTVTNPLVILYHLLQTQRYALRFFDDELKKIVESVQQINFLDVKAEAFEKMVDRVANLKRLLMTFANEIFWIESEMPSVHSVQTLKNYQDTHATDYNLNDLLRRLESLDSFVQSIILKTENKRQRSIQRSLDLLSILFGIFAVAEVASGFLIWYLNSMVARTPVPFQFIVVGTVGILAMVSALYVFAIRFVRRK